MFVTERTTGDPLALIPSCGSGARSAPLHAGRRRDDDGRSAVAQRRPARFYAIVVSVFAALALLLAASGIYGLLSYTVAQRRGEIGICMAVGARRGDILRLMVSQGAILVAAGVVVALAAAAVSSRAYGIATDDRRTFVAVPLLLVAVALAACWIPARRVTRVDPMEVLRSSRDPWDASDARTGHEAGRRRSAGPWLGRTGASARRSAKRPSSPGPTERRGSGSARGRYGAGRRLPADVLAGTPRGHSLRHSLH